MTVKIVFLQSAERTSFRRENVWITAIKQEWKDMIYLRAGCRNRLKRNGRITYSFHRTSMTQTITQEDILDSLTAAKVG